jgi:two-component system invasion response regulator UvrY
MRILIVDDNAHLRALARVYAEQAGATEIVDVPDGGAALIAAGAVPFDVAVLDFHMPGPDGLQVTRELLAIQPGLAVVAWTSVLDPAVERAFLEAGAIAHVPKMDTAGLCRVIRERCPATMEPPAAAAA